MTAPVVMDMTQYHKGVGDPPSLAFDGLADLGGKIFAVGQVVDQD